MNNNDRISIGTLLLLYTLQGIPMGLCASLPLIFKEKGASYESLSLFSLVSIPFSLKILWAPFVDTFYFKQVGRRKSWIIPTQIFAGLMMIAGSNYVREWLISTDDTISLLTAFFMSLYFLMATQDIAVDGWALTMLSKENVGWASISNSLGQTIGVFLANQVFLALSDDRWCESYLGTSALIDLPRFMTWWGVFFILLTILLWFWKVEVEEVEGDDFSSNQIPLGTRNVQSVEDDKTDRATSLQEDCGLRRVKASSQESSEGSRSNKKAVPQTTNISTNDKFKLSTFEDRGGDMMQTYKDIFALFSLPAVRTLLIVLIMSKFSYSAMDAAFLFKLQEFGMSKSAMSTISPLFIVVNLLVPTIANKVIARNPLQGFLWGVYAKMFLACVSVVIILNLQYQTASAMMAEPQTQMVFEISTSMTWLIYVLLLSSEAAGTLVFSSVMSFFSKISDPTIGGSSMTLFNTTMNLGSKWPAVLSLFMIPKVTFSHCELFTNHNFIRIEASCASSHQSTSLSVCEEIKGSCVIDYDGYCVVTITLILVGVAWYWIIKDRIKELQSLAISEFQIQQKATR